MTCWLIGSNNVITPEEDTRKNMGISQCGTYIIDITIYIYIHIYINIRVKMIYLFIYFILGASKSNGDGWNKWLNPNAEGIFL